MYPPGTASKHSRWTRVAQSQPCPHPIVLGELRAAALAAVLAAEEVVTRSRWLLQHRRTALYRSQLANSHSQMFD